MAHTKKSVRYHFHQMAHHALAIVKTLAASSESPRGQKQVDPFDVFFTQDAQEINRARQEHLASIGLDLENKRVLEVGAGIGLHTPFFLARNCNVLITDGNIQNVAEIQRRYPGLTIGQLDLDESTDLRPLGEFDVIYCYGLLYHLKNPEQALRSLAEICHGQILLETCVSLGRNSEIQFVRDFSSNNQALSGVGCRPTRAWVMEKLSQYFIHAYVTRTQPDHRDFPVDWDLPMTQLLYRAVFVGSKSPLELTTLLEHLPSRQNRLTNSELP